MPRESRLRPPKERNVDVVSFRGRFSTNGRKIFRLAWGLRGSRNHITLDRHSVTSISLKSKSSPSKKYGDKLHRFFLLLVLLRTLVVAVAMAKVIDIDFENGAVRPVRRGLFRTTNYSGVVESSAVSRERDAPKTATTTALPITTAAARRRNFPRAATKTKRIRFLRGPIVSAPEVR